MRQWPVSNITAQKTEKKTMVTIYYARWIPTPDGHYPVHAMQVPLAELPQFCAAWKAEFEIWW
jgi:hypothetical protein